MAPGSGSAPAGTSSVAIRTPSAMARRWCALTLKHSPVYSGTRGPSCSHSSRRPGQANVCSGSARTSTSKASDNAPWGLADTTVARAPQRTSQAQRCSASSQAGARTWTWCPPRSIAGAASTVAAVRSKGSCTVKLLPSPCSLTTVMCPPMRSTKRWQIDRPSPVPLTRLLVLA
ncbi:hypothetical protein D3C79_713810 [compost metagenome]